MKKVGYFRLSVDSTSDSLYTDLTLILWYVSPEDGLPRFLIFPELKDRLGESMADLVFISLLSKLSNEINTDFKRCRGQSYDNAANMAASYNGIQQQKNQRKKIKFAKFIPLFKFGGPFGC